MKAMQLIGRNNFLQIFFISCMLSGCASSVMPDLLQVSGMSDDEAKQIIGSYGGSDRMHSPPISLNEKWVDSPYMYLPPACDHIIRPVTFSELVVKVSVETVEIKRDGKLLNCDSNPYAYVKLERQLSLTEAKKIASAFTVLGAQVKD